MDDRVGGGDLHRRCFFFQAEDGIRDLTVTGVQTCALPISARLRKLWAIAATMLKRAKSNIDRMSSRRRSWRAVSVVRTGELAAYASAKMETRDRKSVV